MRRLLSTLILAAATVAAACAAPTGEDADGSGAASSTADLRPELAQVNDVSILFPLARSRAAFDQAYLTPTSAARGGALLAKPTYERAFGPPGTLQIGGTPAAPLLSGLRLVAVRFDPCFAEREPRDEAACKNQVRLVFQTLTFEGGRAVAADDAVHAFYSLSRSELKDALTKVIDLRRRIAGTRRLGGLGPHPLLSKPNGDVNVEVAREMNALVASLAGPDNLVQITQFAPSGLGTTWNFSGFDVEKNATMAIPTLPAGDDKHVAFFAGFTPNALEGDPAFVPASTASAADNLQLLGNRMTAAASSADARRRAFDAMLRIEHPAQHTPDTIDCASCHAVEPIRKLVGKKLFASEMNGADGAFIPDARWVPDADVEQTAQPDSGVNVHMFSYKGTVASIHRRTINESAAVVAHVNARVLARTP